MTEQTCRHSNLTITIDHDTSRPSLSSGPGSSPGIRLRKPGLHGRARIWGPNKTVRMILLTTALMGLQFTWSVEMAYGTPFLLQLGLSKSLMSLVWLAGPLSGLVMQPVVGVLSDRCTSTLGRRRPFLIVGVAAVVVSFFCLGWCKEIMTGVFGADYANEAAASWASRLMGLGGIFGYFMGNINLPELIPAFGDTQIKGLCIIACLFLIFTVGLTCFTVTERVMVRAIKVSTSSVDEFLQGFKSIFRAIRYLPTRIQYLCNVQFFAWMGWFPFLFYSSTYIAEIYTQETSRIDPNDPMAQEPGVGVQDAAVRAGSYCLLVYSIVSLIASIILPVFVAPAESPQTGSKGPFSTARTEAGLGRNRRSSECWKRWPRWLRLPIRGLTLPRMYTLSLALVSFSLVSTWYVHDLRGSTILFAGCGVAWAVSMWAPFSILGEVISQQMQEEQHQGRLRGGVNGSARTESVEVLYSKDELDDDEAEGEEIGMIEGQSGKQYQPVRVRESMEETFGTMRSRTTTPSPTTADGSLGPGAGSSTWRIATEHDVDLSKLDSDSDDSGDFSNSEEGGEYKKPRKQRKHHSTEERRSFLSSLVFAAIEPKSSVNDPTGGDQVVVPVEESAGNPDTIGVMLRFGGVMAGIAALLSLRLWKQPRSVAPSSNI
ncbi:hypothetical protein EC991_010419 [Linnemannia zychae]|nr:hypothetical protein EC991_010419 [Linnemannia zychae]